MAQIEKIIDTKGILTTRDVAKIADMTDQCGENLYRKFKKGTIKKKEAEVALSFARPTLHRMMAQVEKLEAIAAEPEPA